MIELSVSAASRLGCVRSRNEDMVLVDTSFIRNDSYQTKVSLESGKRYILAIADGMGGHNKGEVASEDTLRNLQFFFHDIPANLDVGDFNEVIVEWLESINNCMISKGRADERFKGMGTTLVGLAYYHGDFYSLNCGDSRLYRFHDGRLTQLTTDHSPKNMSNTMKHSSVITNCIGGGCGTSFIDMVQVTDKVKAGDIFLLCSDGLTDMIDDQRVAEILADNGNADMLCDAAEAAGGMDNVSCCVIRVK